MMLKDLREHAQCFGIASLTTSDLLALILGTGTSPQPVVHALTPFLDPSGGLRDLMRAEIGELLEAQIPLVKVMQLQAVCELARRLGTQGTLPKPVIRCVQDAAQLVMAEMADLDHEQLRVLVLDVKHQVMSNQVLYQGTLEGLMVRVGEVFRLAMTRKAAAIIVIHNHPSGDPTPSLEDIAMTQELVDAGKLLDIPLLDHLIIGNRRFESIRERLGDRLRWE